MRVGVLTGGGDCPGLNAVIRAVVRKGVAEYGFEFVGFLDGWKGPLENLTTPLGVDEVRGILPRGGTILKTSRTNPKIGDLVIWGAGSHVGIYVGAGKAISTLRNGVRVHGVYAVTARLPSAS